MDGLEALSGSYWAGKLETVVLVMVCALVDDEQSVSVLATITDGKHVEIAVKVAQRDLGKVIGKQGRTARSLRTIVGAAAQKHKQSMTLDIAGSSNG